MAAAAAKSLQSCLTLCDPIDGSPPGFPVPGILQARTLEWVAISFSNAWKWKVKGKSLSHVRLFTTPWTAAYQAPPSMGFSRQEYWSGVPLPSLFTIVTVLNLLKLLFVLEWSNQLILPISFHGGMTGTTKTWWKLLKITREVYRKDRKDGFACICFLVLLCFQFSAHILRQAITPF